MLCIGRKNMPTAPKKSTAQPKVEIIKYPSCSELEKAGKTTRDDDCLFNAYAIGNGYSYLNGYSQNSWGGVICKTTLKRPLKAINTRTNKPITYPVGTSILITRRFCDFTPFKNYPEDDRRAANAASLHQGIGGVDEYYGFETFFLVKPFSRPLEDDDKPTNADLYLWQLTVQELQIETNAMYWGAALEYLRICYSEFDEKWLARNDWPNLRTALAEAYHFNTEFKDFASPASDYYYRRTFTNESNLKDYIEKCPAPLAQLAKDDDSKSKDLFSTDPTLLREIAFLGYKQKEVAMLEYQYPDDTKEQREEKTLVILQRQINILKQCRFIDRTEALVFYKELIDAHLNPEECLDYKKDCAFLYDNNAAFFEAREIFHDLKADVLNKLKEESGRFEQAYPELGLTALGKLRNKAAQCKSVDELHDLFSPSEKDGQKSWLRKNIFLPTILKAKAEVDTRKKAINSSTESYLETHWLKAKLRGYSNIACLAILQHPRSQKQMMNDIKLVENELQQKKIKERIEAGVYNRTAFPQIKELALQKKRKELAVIKNAVCVELIKYAYGPFGQFWGCLFWVLPHKFNPWHHHQARIVTLIEMIQAIEPKDTGELDACVKEIGTLVSNQIKLYKNKVKEEEFEKAEFKEKIAPKKKKLGPPKKEAVLKLEPQQLHHKPSAFFAYNQLKPLESTANLKGGSYMALVAAEGVFNTMSHQ